MTQDQQENLSLADEMAALLPFYASGQLDGEDRQRVEAWLSENPGAQTALDNMHMERQEVISSNEAIALPRHGLDRLMRSIEAEDPERRVVASGDGFFARLIDTLNAVPSSLALGACAVLLAITLAQGVFLIGDNRGGPFTTASGNGPEAPAGPVAVVSFAPGATAVQIQKVLEEADATIVSGPRGAGFYEVRFIVGDQLKPVADRIKSLSARTAIIASFMMRVDKQ